MRPPPCSDQTQGHDEAPEARGQGRLPRQGSEVGGQQGDPPGGVAQTASSAPSVRSQLPRAGGTQTQGDVCTPELGLGTTPGQLWRWGVSPHLRDGGSPPPAALALSDVLTPGRAAEGTPSTSGHPAPACGRHHSTPWGTEEAGTGSGSFDPPTQPADEKLGAEGFLELCPPLRLQGHRAPCPHSVPSASGISKAQGKVEAGGTQ